MGFSHSVTEDNLSSKTNKCRPRALDPLIRPPTLPTSTTLPTSKMVLSNIISPPTSPPTSPADLFMLGMDNTNVWHISTPTLTRKVTLASLQPRGEPQDGAPSDPLSPQRVSSKSPMSPLGMLPPSSSQGTDSSVGETEPLGHFEVHEKQDHKDNENVTRPNRLTPLPTFDKWRTYALPINPRLPHSSACLDLFAKRDSL